MNVIDLSTKARKEAGNRWEASTREAGENLADDLNPWIGTTSAIRDTCVRLVTLAREHADWQTIDCNRGLQGEEAQREEDVCDAIMDAARDLPQPDAGPWRVELQGDPRGATVMLLAPEHDAEQRNGVAVDR